MARMYDVSQQELTESLAKALQKVAEVQPPEWAQFVKTGHSKERAPDSDDWWFMRAASIMRVIYQKGPIGVSKLRTRYGSRKNRGVKPERFYIASGSIIRKILQQLEAAELASQVEKGVHKGRSLTPKGVSLVDKTALSIRPKHESKPDAKPETKGKPKEKPEPKPEAKAKPESKVKPKAESKPTEQEAKEDGKPRADPKKQA